MGVAQLYQDARGWVIHLPHCAQADAMDDPLQDLVTFHSRDSEDKIVYHTNVMMAIGTDVAVVCSESVHDDKERQHLLARLSATHSVVDISKAQMGHLCGNVLELEDGRGLPVFAMSSQVPPPPPFPSWGKDRPGGKTCIQVLNNSL